MLRAEESDALSALQAVRRELQALWIDLLADERLAASGEATGVMMAMHVVDKQTARRTEQQEGNDHA